MGGSEQEARFRGEGFLVAGTVPGPVIDELVAAHRRLDPGDVGGCQPSTNHHDERYRRTASDIVRAWLDPVVKPLLPGYRSHVGAFVVKRPGPGSAMAAHRDWSSCDERRWWPVNVWVPLCDVDDQNGALVVHAGSHAGPWTPRGSGLEVVGRCAEAAPPQVLQLQAGKIVCYDPALLHSSGSNRSSGDRLAVAMSLQPTEARLLHYSREGPTIVAHEVQPEFFTADHRPGEPIEGPVVDVIADIDVDRSSHR